MSDRDDKLLKGREVIAKSEKEHPEFTRKLTKILYEQDLMRLKGFPEDEYAPEAGTIVPRLETANHAGDVQNILFEEFRRWFGEDESKRQSEPYKRAARRIWNAWVAYDSGLE